MASCGREGRDGDGTSTSFCVCNNCYTPVMLHNPPYTDYRYAMLFVLAGLGLVCLVLSLQFELSLLCNDLLTVRARVVDCTCVSDREQCLHTTVRYSMQLQNDQRVRACDLQAATGVSHATWSAVNYPDTRCCIRDDGNSGT